MTYTRPEIDVLNLDSRDVIVTSVSGPENENQLPIG